MRTIDAKDKRCFYRGGNIIHEVVKYGPSESQVRNPQTGLTFNCYNAHLTPLGAKDRIADRRAVTNSIGRPKNKPGKK